MGIADFVQNNPAMTADSGGVGGPGRLFARLRAERIAQKLSAEWVADRLGVTKQTISDYELEKDRPSAGLLRRWLTVLNLPPDWATAWRRGRLGQRIDRLLTEGGMPPESRTVVLSVINHYWPPTADTPVALPTPAAASLSSSTARRVAG